MRVLFLNIESGAYWGELRDYLKVVKEDLDVMCFQEIGNESLVKCREILEDFNVYSIGGKESIGGVYFLAIFVRKNLKVAKHGEIMRNIKEIGLGMWVEIKNKENSLLVVNVHGVPKPGEKLDNASRLRQSEICIDLVRERGCEAIIGGDFNLMPETESVGVFSKNGFLDLIKEYGVTNTRNELVWSRHEVKQFYSDYVFVSEELEVLGFIVPQPEEVLVSDHQPMILKIG